MSRPGVCSRDSFVFYRSFKECLSDLLPEERLLMYEAISDYALNKTEPELSGFSKALFSLIRPQLDANWKKYENGCKGAEHGKKGGAPKGNKNASSNGRTTPKQPQGNGRTTPKQPQGNGRTTPNDNVNVNDNDNDNVGCSPELFPEKKTKKRPRKKEDFVPPELDEIVFYFQHHENRLPDAEIQANKFFNHYTSVGWKKPSGAQVVNWEGLANNWILEEKIKPKDQNGQTKNQNENEQERDYYVIED